jgi:hypothetical protein
MSHKLGSNHPSRLAEDGEHLRMTAEGGSEFVGWAKRSVPTILVNK